VDIFEEEILHEGKFPRGKFSVGDRVRIVSVKKKRISCTTGTIDYIKKVNKWIAGIFRNEGSPDFVNTYYHVQLDNGKKFTRFAYDMEVRS
jgi:hypothetical protein